MKKIASVLILFLLIVLPLMAAGMVASASAESYDVLAPTEADQVVDEEVEVPPDSEPVVPGEPLTWPYLGTIAGAAALALLIVQYTKAPLDHIWKIPTKLFVYLVCLVIMLVATAINNGLTFDNIGLVIVNALIAAITAYGAYEVTFKRTDSKVKAVSKPL